MPMPHVVLQSPQNLDELEALFDLKHLEKSEIHVSYTAVFQNKANNGLLIETYIKEEPLAQRVGITVRQREGNTYVIGLSEIGFPRPTFGIQLAISGVAKRLLALDEKSVVVSQNLADGLLG